MKYVQGDETKTADAIWYFTKPGAEVFPGPHAFGSDVWDEVHPTQTTLGWDATVKRTYYAGDPLNSSDGNSFAGPQQYFLDGQPSDAVPLARAADGTPAVCLPLQGGLMVSGSASTPAAAPGSCAATFFKSRTLSFSLTFAPALGYAPIDPTGCTLYYAPGVTNFPLPEVNFGYEYFGTIKIRSTWFQVYGSANVLPYCATYVFRSTPSPSSRFINFSFAVFPTFPLTDGGFYGIGTLPPPDWSGDILFTVNPVRPY